MAERDATPTGRKAAGASAADRHVARQLWLTRAGLWAERITRAFWPAWTVAFTALAVWSTEVIPPLWSLSLLAALALLFGVVTILGIRGFRTPDEAEIRGRLDATLPGR
ncbi:MAG: DUF4175 family protein, partial [Jannaschia sp.]